MLLAVLVIFAIVVVAKSVALIPQAEAAVIERLGRYSRTVSGQLTLLVPFIDRIRARVDLRERVVSFPPQPVITEDNLTLNIDTVVYFQVTVPRRPSTRSATTSSASNSSPPPRCATWSAA
ncbi:SPFH domain / Band 7 family protein [Mycobacterium avium subsp. avium 2285 (R)]|nr:SPFH domain / Band 7 family protein [Mycobacterium avium subsp. avium 2285 (R)]